MTDPIAVDGDLALRAMRDRRADYELMRRWLNTAHVREWWDPDLPPYTYERVVDEYRPYMTASSSTTACVITVGGADAGYIQFYPWVGEADYQRQLGLALPATAWGLDLFIGEQHFLHRGHGRRAVALACAHLVAELGATEVDLLTEVGNLRAQNTYLAAGFTRVGVFLDTDTRGGERIRSWLMRWEPAGG
jgi:aminoglycoside 6'-N-acetyltransferase